MFVAQFSFDLCATLLRGESETCRAQENVDKQERSVLSIKSEKKFFSQ